MEGSVSVLKNIAFPTFKYITEFPGYSVGLAHHLKGDNLMNKPIFIGSTMLGPTKYCPECLRACETARGYTI